MALLDTMGLRRMPGTILPRGDDVYVEGLPDVSVAALKVAPDNVYILAHVPACYGLDAFKVITVIRDPRNVVLSYIAHRRRDGCIYGFPQALEDFWGHPFVPVYRGYLGWRGRAAVLRYEDLPGHVIGDGAGIYRNHDYDWNTRTASPSRWQDVWDGAIQQLWKAAGGDEIVTAAGYQAWTA